MGKTPDNQASDQGAPQEEDPIVELPMEVYCTVCHILIETGIARWPRSHVDQASKLPSWTGKVISHRYCDKHKPGSP